MAYINKEQVSQKRSEIKKAFPDCKFSIRKNAHSSTLQVSLIKSKVEVRQNPDVDGNIIDINHYWIDDSKYLNEYGKKLFKKIKDISNQGNHNRSDSMTDYFDVGWYLDLSIGDYGRPYEVTEDSCDIDFNNDTDSHSKGWNSPASKCFNYIKSYNGTDESYFQCYKGGTVQVVHNSTGEILLETEIF